jgi:hypothetical protein
MRGAGQQIDFSVAAARSRMAWRQLVASRRQQRADSGDCAFTATGGRRVRSAGGLMGRGGWGKGGGGEGGRVRVGVQRCSRENLPGDSLGTGDASSFHNPFPVYVFPGLGGE